MDFRALAFSFTDQRGTTAIEFAIVAPLLLALTVGTLYLGICLFMVGSLHYSVEEAARRASVRSTGDCSTSAKVVSYAQTRYFGPSSPTFTYQPAAACGNSVTGSVSYSLNFVIMHVTVPLSATACFPYFRARSGALSRS